MRSDGQTSARMLHNIHANLHCSARIMVNSESDEAALQSCTLGDEAKWALKFTEVSAGMLHPGAELDPFKNFVGGAGGGSRASPT